MIEPEPIPETLAGVSWEGVHEVDAAGPAAASAQADLPDYDDLPEVRPGRRAAWGLFGGDDSLGLVNLQTPDRVVTASRLVTTGVTFCLNAPQDVMDPPLFGRRPFEHAVVEVSPRPMILDDYIGSFYPQASSQWDSLGHVGLEPDIFYNGRSRRDVVDLHLNTVEHWARRGIVGRGVLLDLEPEWLGDDSAHRAGKTEMKVDDLERARRRSGFQYQPGDVLIINTGFLRWYRELDAVSRRELAERGDHFAAPGLARGPDMVRYLWQSHVSAIVTDSPALEVMPLTKGVEPVRYDFLHTDLIGGFGMAIGELFHLNDLVVECRRSRKWEFLFVSAPLNIPGGIGSTANAVAIM
jgi:kynurenine formamidase